MTTTPSTTIYAELPEPHRVLHEAVFIEDVETPVYTEQQARTFADETHALRIREGDFIVMRAADLRAAIASTAALPYSIDADPLGIRALVADTIMGALAFGAQGNNPPPEGHWLAPFWEMARCERASPGASDELLPRPAIQQIIDVVTRIKRGALADWAASRWHDEVANRPLVNIHRRSLDGTWRQVLRYAGADDRVRLGPTHDELVAPQHPRSEP